MSVSPNGKNGSPSGYNTVRHVQGGMPEIAPSDHDTVKAVLRPKLAKFAENICQGVEENQRNAMNLFARIMGMVGAEVEIQVAVLLRQELGVSSMEEAKRKLSMVASVEGIDEDGAVSLMEQRVRSWYAQRGFRVMIVKEEEAVGT